MTSDSTIDIGLDSRKPWIQAGTLRPELDHNTGRHFDTPLRLVTSRPSFRQTRHLASHNISIIVHETSKFRYTWRESWCNCIWKTLYLNLYSQLASVEIHLRPFPHHGLGRDHVIRHRSGIRVWLAEHPSELCDFHSQSQGRCWYVRTALETLCTQIGGEWSASRAKENYWTLLESEFDSGSTSHLSVYLTPRDLTAWSQQLYCDDKCPKQLYSVWILPVNYKRIMNRHARRIDPSTHVLTLS